MPQEQNILPEINVRRGRVDSLDIYEITRDELEILKQGSSSSIFFNFSVAFFSIFISIGATLLTVSINSDRIFYVFVIVLIISLIAGIITTLLCIKGKNSFKETVKRIEERIQDKEYKVSDSSIEVIE